MRRNYRRNTANEINTLGVYNFCDEVRGRSWSVGLNMMLCWGGFQDIAYWSTKG